MTRQMHFAVILALVLGSLVIVALVAVALDTLRLSPEEVARAHAIVSARTRERRV